jgi:squalene monooxygenase/farnesyl-diphosphate farnesyltransferase/lanosterol synthase
MRLLAVRETRRIALGVTFARLLTTASRQLVTGVLNRPLSQTLATAAGFGRWAGWYARENFVP